MALRSIVTTLSDLVFDAIRVTATGDPCPFVLGRLSTASFPQITARFGVVLGSR
jgi:hypothetical protein